MRRSALALAVIFLSGCSWLSMGLPSGDQTSSVSDSMMRDDAMMKDDDSMMDNDDAMMDDDAMEGSDAMMKDEKAVSTSSAAMMMKKEESSKKMVAASGMYTAYHDGVIGNGETSVLFFHAGWCPFCQQADKDLTQWYGSTGFPLTVYKVNYDAQTDLKSRYGVTTQHTFVKIDGSGNAVKTIVGPSNATLKAFIGA